MGPDYLLKSLFILFLGLITFLFTIINKKTSYIPLVSEYFVLFLFFGIIISIIGGIMLLIWNFENRKPFEEKIVIKKHYTPYLSYGVLLILIGLTLMYYFSSLREKLLIFSILLSCGGIILLFIGLIYFLKEEFISKKVISKIQQHS